LRRLPDEEEPQLLGWFAACLMLSVVVVAAFLLVGDISSPAKARLIALPQQPAASVVLARSACRGSTAPARTACPAEPGGKTALVVEQ
jgi:hypothetical protein